MRKPVGEFELSSEACGTAKRIDCRITSVKQCAVAPTVVLLYTQDRSQLDTKQSAVAPTVPLLYTHRTGHN
jgi:hypothetical protein